MSREAMEQIKKHLDAAQAEIWAAEAIADEHELDFSLNIGTYGMGGYYDGAEQEWHASSQSC